MKKTTASLAGVENFNMEETVMKKIYAFLLLAAIAGFTLASCSKTEPDTPTTPTTQPSEPKEPTVVKHTIPFKITVALPTDTKVTLEDETNFKYVFLPETRFLFLLMALRAAWHILQEKNSMAQLLTKMGNLFPVRRF